MKSKCTQNKVASVTNQTSPIFKQFGTDFNTSRQINNLNSQPLRPNTATMASKITPFVFRSAFRPARIASRTQCRAITTTPRLSSDALQVVSSPSPLCSSKYLTEALHSIETAPKTTPASPSSSQSKTTNSSKRSCHGIPHNTRKRL